MAYKISPSTMLFLLSCSISIFLSTPQMQVTALAVGNGAKTTCFTSTASIATCGTNPCESAWASKWTTNAAYVQGFCRSFTDEARTYANIFDRTGPATACIHSIPAADAQVTLSSICSCYAGPQAPTAPTMTSCSTSYLSGKTPVLTTSAPVVTGPLPTVTVTTTATVFVTVGGKI